MADEKLYDFRLVGGTALSLQLGYRKSVDIDLFSDKPFNIFQLFEHLHVHHSYVQNNFSEQGTKGYIGFIQCDFFNHNHVWIDKKPVIIEGIRMASFREIAAMKIFAIIESNGTRLKDFVDIAFLSEKISVEQMLQAFMEKYKGFTDTLVLKSLFYYDNIDHQKPVKYIERNLTWKQIETRLDLMQKNPVEVFSSLL